MPVAPRLSRVDRRAGRQVEVCRLKTRRGGQGGHLPGVARVRDPWHDHGDGEAPLVGALLSAPTPTPSTAGQGRWHSLLDQERPNIFTQSVGNLPPGGEVRIRIAYVEQLAYDRGAYEFHLPLVVGPRYMPGSKLPGARSGTGVHPDTDQVPDAARISPPVLLPDSAPATMSSR
jgi:hypothetical protein